MSAVSLQWYNVNGMNEMSDITGFSFMSFTKLTPGPIDMSAR